VIIQQYSTVISINSLFFFQTFRNIFHNVHRLKTVKMWLTI